MRVLVADDNIVQRTLLAGLLGRWGHAVEVVADGDAAWAALVGDDPPDVALLDWMMPGTAGPELCRRLRGAARPGEGRPRRATYLVVLTARTATADVVAALDAGADDHIAKPFAPAELQARLRAGERTLHLRRRLADRVQELEAALARVKRLEGILPICSYCKSVRASADAWRQLEGYIQEHSDARFSHGVCPGCHARHVAPELARFRAEAAHET